jgi:hypothetical protein
VGVLEIRGHHDAKAHAIRISITVFIGKDGFPFPEEGEVVRGRLPEGHDFDLELG